MTIKYQNLVARPWTKIGGKNDCYALVQEFYLTNFKRTLTNFARPHDWSSDNIDLIRNNYEREGFDMITDWKIKDLRPGDILAMTIGESNPNHLAIYLGELGDGTDEIVHHLYGRMSRAEPFAGFWRNHVSFILRHPDTPDLRHVYPDVDLMDLIRARTSAPTK